MDKGNQNTMGGLEASETVKLCHNRALSLLKINTSQQANLLKQYIFCLTLFFAGCSFLLGTSDYFAQKSSMVSHSPEKSPSLLNRTYNAV